MKKRVFLIIIIILALILIFLTFFFYRPCSNEACFRDALAGCKRASYIEESQGAIWKYKIHGESYPVKLTREIIGIEKASCEVYVELEDIKDNLELERGEGLSMTCSVNYGTYSSPQADTTRCTGELREFLQDQIIQRLHKYILNNLGEIDENLEKIIPTS